MATKINTFAVSHLTKGAHCDFHNRVNNLITAIGATELHIEALAAQYAEALATELSIVNRETASQSGSSSSKKEEEEEETETV